MKKVTLLSIMVIFLSVGIIFSKENTKVERPFNEIDSWWLTNNKVLILNFWNRKLTVISLDGNKKIIFEKDVSYAYPSPKGSLIAVPLLDGSFWVVDNNGNKNKQVDKGMILKISWSPDEKHLVYSIKNKDGNIDTKILKIADFSSNPIHKISHK